MAQGDESISTDVVVAVLAAGRGRRMRSGTPKHLHLIAGVPIVERAIRAGIDSGARETLVVVSPNMKDIDQLLGLEGKCTPVVQEPARGTADAVRHALYAAGDATWLVSLLGDNPLLTGEVVRELVARAKASGSLLTLLTSVLPDAAAYGRVERDDQGRVTRIIEQKNDDPASRTGPTEINSGVMVLNAAWAREELSHMPLDPVTGEFLLTDLIDLAVRTGSGSGESWPVDTVVADDTVTLGVNDRLQLQEVDAIARRIIRERHVRNGVTIIGPDTVFIDERVTIGEDTVIAPHSILTGTTVIGRDCQVGPAAVLDNAQLADGVTVEQSTIRNSTVGAGTHVGPYAHLRAGCQIGRDVHIGSYSELKNAKLADGVKCGHVSYLGDVTVGVSTNIGAGTITANYDGQQKHVTTIGDGVFVGCDTVLVAPVRLGDGSSTGAGAVVNRDVEADSTVVGVPARPIDKREGRKRH